jgi:hypothetical protein
MSQFDGPRPGSPLKWEATNVLKWEATNVVVSTTYHHMSIEPIENDASGATSAS